MKIKKQQDSKEKPFCGQLFCSPFHQVGTLRVGTGTGIKYQH